MTAFRAGRTGHILTLPGAEFLRQLRRHRRRGAFRGEEGGREDAQGQPSSRSGADRGRAARSPPKMSETTGNPAAKTAPKQIGTDDGGIDEVDR